MTTSSESEFSDFENDMDPELRDEILKLLDNSFNYEAHRDDIDFDIFKKLEEDYVLQEKFLQKVVYQKKQEANIFFAKKETPEPFSKRQLRELDSHFTIEYRRRQNLVEVQEIIEIYMRNPKTLNIAPLVQPSMSGKSRLVSEFAKSVPSIYVCFRENVASTGYPMCTRQSMLFFQKLLEIDRRDVREDILLYCFFSIVKELASVNLEEMDFEALWTRQVKGEKSFFRKSRLKEGTYEPNMAVLFEKVWSEYEQKLQVKGVTGSLKLLIVFDEARFFWKRSDDTVSLERNVRKALTKLQKFMPGVFILLVDTTSHVGDFIRKPNPGATSGLFNAPIYTFDTFDVFLEDGKVSLPEVGSEEDILRMGRPGWNIYHSLDVEFARQKILIGTDPSDESRMNGRLASILCIYGITLRGSTELASLLISEHMAFPRCISADRSSISCFYRSEPALVFGAHSALRFLNGLEAFSFLFQNGEFESGERGEVIARMLITHCVSEYCDTEHCVKKSYIYGLNFLSLSEFFKAIHLEVPSFEIPKTGRVHLTHWVEISCELKPHMLLKYYFRGAAIVCKMDKRVIDFVIPVFIDTPENQHLIDNLKLSHSDIGGTASLGDVENEIKKVFSVVAVQVKNDSFSENSKALNHLDEEVLSLLGDLCHGRSFVFNLQMNGSPKQDEVVNGQNCVKIHRQSVEAWEFSKMNLESLRELLKFRLKPDQQVDGEAKKVLAEKREGFLLNFCDIKEFKSQAPPRKQQKP